MPKVKQFTDCRIAIYPRDHRPPHVHIEFRNGERCTVEIESLKVDGRVRPRARLAEALAFVGSNQAKLMAMWKELVR